jgi:hypothetical protein
LKIKLLIFIGFVSFLVSCAGLKLKPITCEEYYHKIVINDQKIPSKFSFKGNLVYTNLNLLIKGEFKNEDNGKIKIYLPFGLFAGEVILKDGEYCFKINKSKGCVKNIFNLKTIFDIDIPLQNLISGKFNLKGKEKFYCENKKLYIEKAGYTIIYDFVHVRDKKRFLPKKVLYHNYSVEYLYNVEGKEKIIDIFYQNERIIKIEINKIEKL